MKKHKKNKKKNKNKIKALSLSNKTDELLEIRNNSDPFDSSEQSVSKSLSVTAQSVTTHSVTIDKHGNLQGIEIDITQEKEIKQLSIYFNIKQLIPILIKKYTDIGSIPSELIEIEKALISLGIITSTVTI